MQSSNVPYKTKKFTETKSLKTSSRVIQKCVSVATFKNSQSRFNWHSSTTNSQMYGSSIDKHWPDFLQFICQKNVFSSENWSNLEFGDLLTEWQLPILEIISGVRREKRSSISPPQLRSKKAAENVKGLKISSCKDCLCLTPRWPPNLWVILFERQWHLNVISFRGQCQPVKNPNLMYTLIESKYAGSIQIILSIFSILYKVGNNANIDIICFTMWKQKCQWQNVETLDLWFQVQHSPLWTNLAFACKTETLGSLHSHALLILTESSKSKNQVVHEHNFKDL